MSVSREAKLSSYAQLIRRWNGAINLVAASTLPDLEHRHFADSRSLSSIIPPDAKHWTDLGSGGGLPGVIIAIDHPDIAVTLIEADRRKAAFLTTVARELGLRNCEVVAQRIEQAIPRLCQNVSARALAPLPRLMPYVHRHLAEDGVAWLMKGRNWRAELDDVAKSWTYDLDVHPSTTRSDSVILKFTNLALA